MCRLVEGAFDRYEARSEPPAPLPLVGSTNRVLTPVVAAARSFPCFSNKEISSPLDPLCVKITGLPSAVPRNVASGSPASR